MKGDYPRIVQRLANRLQLGQVGWPIAAAAVDEVHGCSRCGASMVGKNYAWHIISECEDTASARRMLEDDMEAMWIAKIEEKRAKASRRRKQQDEEEQIPQQQQENGLERKLTIKTIERHQLWHEYKDPFMQFVKKIMIRPESSGPAAGKTVSIAAEKEKDDPEEEEDFECWFEQGEMQNDDRYGEEEEQARPK